MVKLLVDGIPVHRGGIGTIIIAITSRLDKQIFKIDFLSTYKTDYEQEIFSMGGTLKTIPPFGRRPFAYVCSLKKLFNSQSYDFIWINNTSKINMFLPYYGKKYADAKIIFHSHGTNNEMIGWKKNVAKIIEKFNEKSFYKLLDIPCACSVASANYFYDSRKLNNPIHIIKNAINVEDFKFDAGTREKMRKKYIVDCKTVLGTVGRLAEIKNQRFLIDLMHELKICGKDNCKLLIVGDGPEKERLVKYAKEKNVFEETLFIGDVSNVGDYLQMFDFFLLPSLYEGLPLALIEAQACGLKCLVSNTISREGNVTKTISFLPLNDIALWKNEILNHKAEERSSYYKRVIEAGYDISTSAKEFQTLLNSAQKKSGEV